MEMTFSPRICLSCGKPITGRKDKKFCDDQCRATFNNQNRKSYEFMIMNTNSQLRKNRTILRKLCPTGKATVRKSILKDLGFEFGYFTSMYQSGENNTYFLCYEYGYMPIEEFSYNENQKVPKVVIIQQQQYMGIFDPWRFSSGGPGKV